MKNMLIVYNDTVKLLLQGFLIKCISTSHSSNSFENCNIEKCPFVDSIRLKGNSGHIYRFIIAIVTVTYTSKPNKINNLLLIWKNIWKLQKRWKRNYLWFAAGERMQCTIGWEYLVLKAQLIAPFPFFTFSRSLRFRFNSTFAYSIEFFVILDWVISQQTY